MAKHQPTKQPKPMTTNQDQPTKAQDLLHRAADLMDERGKQYDQRSGERSMQATVTAFNAIAGYHLTESDGFLLLSILKMVRDQQREMPHRDSIEDLVAYSSLYGEARLRGEERRQEIAAEQEKTATESAVTQFTREQLLNKLADANQSPQEARYARR